jgi:hypothetical protein
LVVVLVIGFGQHRNHYTSNASASLQATRRQASSYVIVHNRQH